MEAEHGYHFTYGTPDVDLCQGDLLAKSDAVRDLLRDVHPHYTKPDYTHLLVLTQSCDLVRRKEGTCKARYISLAAVRPLSLVLEREIAQYQDAFASEAGVCAKGGPQSQNKRKLQEFVVRILNNNEPEFFYLEPDIALGLAEPSCAFLQLSIAVRGPEHYEKLLAARVLALAEVFQAKLGWLVGNLYSRVGTPDWTGMSRSQFDKKVQTLLGEIIHWVDDEQLERARAERPGAATREELRKHIQAVSIPKPRDLVIDEVLTIFQREKLIAAEDAPKVRNMLGNDPVLAGHLKDLSRS